jgi:two-component system OmpR family sensor kinase
MKSPFSIAKRLSIGLVLGVVCFWLGAALIAGLVVQHELNEAFDQSLEQAAIRLLPLAIHDLEELAEGEQPENEYRIASLESYSSNFAYYIRDAEGRRIALSDDLRANIVSNGVPNGFSNINNIRYFAITDPESGFGIVIAERSNHRDQALWESISALLLPLAALIPLMVFGIWYAIKRAMKPVEKLQRDVSERDGSNLSPLTTNIYPLELAPIAEEIANLLDRLSSALNSERAFAAKSAHELRTPLAGALAQAQRLSIELTDGKGQQRATDIEKSLRHLSDLSEKLLQFSRLEAGFAKTDQDIDLMPVLSLILNDFRADTNIGDRVKLLNPKNHQFKAGLTKDAFAILLRNLVENGLIHGAGGGLVQIEVQSSTSLSISNDGAIISQEMLERLGLPFERGDTDAKGTGLGLSITRSIVEQCDGEFKIFSPRRNESSGFEVFIRF